MSVKGGGYPLTDKIRKVVFEGLLKSALKTADENSEYISVCSREAKLENHKRQEKSKCKTQIPVQAAKMIHKGMVLSILLKYYWQGVNIPTSVYDW